MICQTPSRPDRPQSHRVRRVVAMACTPDGKFQCLSVEQLQCVQFNLCLSLLLLASVLLQNQPPVANPKTAAFFLPSRTVLLSIPGSALARQRHGSQSLHPLDSPGSQRTLPTGLFLSTTPPRRQSPLRPLFLRAALLGEFHLISIIVMGHAGTVFANVSLTVSVIPPLRCHHQRSRVYM